MDSIHVWHDDTYRSKMLRGTVPTQVYDLKLNVTGLEFFYVKVLRSSVYNVSFCETFDGFDSCFAW